MIKYNETYFCDLKQIIQSIDGIDRLFGKTIAITGANGLICSPIVDILFYLNKRYNADISIVILGRNEDKIKQRFSELSAGNDYKIVPFDAVLTRDICINADFFIYGASMGDPAAIMRDPVSVILSNVCGVDVCLKNISSDARFLYISSSEVYGQRAYSEEPILESEYGYVDILNPRASYPNGKRTAETLCLAYHYRDNKDVVIVRPGHIYGPTISESDSRATAEFTRRAVKGDNIVMKTAGAQLRSYCYMLDCASAIIQVLLQGKSGEAYNISNPNSIVSISDIAHAIAEQSGVKVLYQNASEKEKSSYNMMENSTLNSAKLLALGWKPLFSVEKGVSRTLELFLE